MLTIDQALSKQVELLKRTVDITDAFEFVEVPVEVLRVLIEDHELLANMTAERDGLKAQLDEEKRKRNATNMVAANMKAEWDAMREERDKLQALVKELENPDLVATITPLRKLFAEYFDGVASLTYGGQVEGKIKGDDK